MSGLIVTAAPGEVPGSTPAAVAERMASNQADLPNEFLFKEMRKATRDVKKRKSVLGACWSVFWCLVPDILEDAGSAVVRGGLKATVNAITLLQTVANLDPKKFKDELTSMIKGGLPSDLTRYEYNNDTGKLPGRLTSREMIYCARLSLLAYLTRDVSYDKFFPEHREDEIVGHAFDDGANEVHQIFLVNYVASLFDTKKLMSDGTANPRFGYAYGIANGLNQMNLELVYPFDVNDNEGYIAKSKDFEKFGGDVVIAFQGTTDRHDFMTNFEGTLTPFEPLFDRKNAGSCACLQGTLLGNCCLRESAAIKNARKNFAPAGRAHVGFYEAFLSVKEIIQANLESLFRNVVPDGKPVRIVITGHSLGGALASLCTAWIMQWFRYVFPGGLPPNFRVLSITFGQPKVGDDAFVDAVDKDEWTNWSETTNAKFKTYRIFTPNDPVVTTPPVALGYRHCYAMCLIRQGHMYFLPQSMANTVDTTAEGLRKAIDKGLSVMHFHDLFNYLNAVMHFADLTRGEQDIEQVFGSVDYEADVRAPDFFDTF